MLSAFVWAGAQQPTSPAAPDAQSTAPTAGQSQSAPTAPDTAAPAATPQSDAGTAANVTQGCLGGSNPNYTITDASGKTYKLMLPANANGATLASHIGESVAVMGDKSADSINVTKVGRGSTTCTK